MVCHMMARLLFQFWFLMLNRNRKNLLGGTRTKRKFLSGTGAKTDKNFGVELEPRKQKFVGWDRNRKNFLSGTGTRTDKILGWNRNRKRKKFLGGTGTEHFFRFGPSLHDGMRSDV
jgi:hypothetical protein